MGAGKTTVGRLLADSLQRPFIDLDQRIETVTSRTISELFAEKGETGFRKLEATVLEQVLQGEQSVIAVGGGALTNRHNVHTMRATGELVWLHAPFEDMVARAMEQGGRPLLARGTDVKALYDARLPVYRLADVVVDVSGLAPVEAARAVEGRLRARGAQGAIDDTGDTPAATSDVEPEIVTVDLGERAYEVHVGPGLLSGSGELCDDIRLADTGLLVTNDRVGGLYAATMVRSLAKSGRKVPRVDIPEGEAYKTAASLSTIYDSALTYKLDRSTTFYALGGGVVGDVAGFAAASYLRGVNFVQAPTSLLAQVDSSVGGKTGINLPQGKNLIGAFHQPRLVLADVNTLRTLPERELAAGFAEVIKYGAIADAPFLAYLEDRRERLHKLDGPALTKTVARSCQNKADIVQQDERETGGVRELLNFGHTVGHALEVVGGFSRWLHGEAVALGMVTAALLSRRFGGLRDEDVARLVDLLRAYNLPVVPGPIDSEPFQAALQLDKKTRKGRPRFVLLERLGSAFVSDEVTYEWVYEALREQQTL